MRSGLVVVRGSQLTKKLVLLLSLHLAAPPSDAILGVRVLAPLCPSLQRLLHNRNRFE
jgi:hypothetical protein